VIVGERKLYFGYGSFKLLSKSLAFLSLAKFSATIIKHCSISSIQSLQDTFERLNDGLMSSGKLLIQDNLATLS
jgi:hypothetical protein